MGKEETLMEADCFDGKDFIGSAVNKYALWK